MNHDQENDRNAAWLKKLLEGLDASNSSAEAMAQKLYLFAHGTKPSEGEIARIIGRTPHDLGTGCDEKCATDGGTCICAELYRPAALKIIQYVNRSQ